MRADPDLKERVTSQSERELEALSLLAGVGRTKGVARQLGISPRTVENHLASARLKLGVETTLQAISLFQEASGPDGAGRLAEPAIGLPAAQATRQAVRARAWRLTWVRTGIRFGFGFAVVYAGWFLGHSSGVDSVEAAVPKVVGGRADVATAMLRDAGYRVSVIGLDVTDETGTTLPLSSSSLRTSARFGTAPPSQTSSSI
jgi:DNA-binding CsgD family transcriptional regulator